MANGGWLHRLTDAPRLAPIPRPQSKRVPRQDLPALWQLWRDRTQPADIDALADALGVGAIALDCLGAAVSPHNAWAFPMRDAEGKIVGIRLRDDRGGKWAVTGSHQGLFLPECPPADRTCYVCEGPTDAAAALTLGLYAIGRPSAQGAEDMLLARLRPFRRVVIVADQQRPDSDPYGVGIAGAESLQAKLTCPSVILIPPCKDLRELVRQGYDHTVLNALIGGLVWTVR